MLDMLAAETYSRLCFGAWFGDAPVRGNRRRIMSSAEKTKTAVVMGDEKSEGPRAGRMCPACRGTGIDKTLHRPYTSGGHDERPCKQCNGDGYINTSDDRESPSP